jgi:hypothetical protein
MVERTDVESLEAAYSGLEWPDSGPLMTAAGDCLSDTVDQHI